RDVLLGEAMGLEVLAHEPRAGRAHAGGDGLALEILARLDLALGDTDVALGVALDRREEREGLVHVLPEVDRGQLAPRVEVAEAALALLAHLEGLHGGRPRREPLDGDVEALFLEVTLLDRHPDGVRLGDRL